MAMRRAFDWTELGISSARGSGDDIGSSSRSVVSAMAAFGIAVAARIVVAEKLRELKTSRCGVDASFGIVLGASRVGGRLFPNSRARCS